MIEIENPLKSFKEFPGPILLLAGPGTGKTWQLEHRVKFLLEKIEASPSEITIITFTNEAARSMRERLLKEETGIPHDQIPENIQTMHSLANTIVGTNTGIVGLSEDYGVLTEKYPQTILLKDASSLCGIERENYLETYNCRIKGDCNKNPGDSKCKVCDKYVELLRKCNLLDYDDQLFLACEILRNYPEIQTYWQAQTKYLLVDEYQDINAIQCELIQLLSSGQEEGLFAVGDDDQSIYSFR
ncbi:MAG: UvrD-helicase domain-containing protein, partial [Bacteroidales bacterium]